MGKYTFTTGMDSSFSTTTFQVIFYWRVTHLRSEIEGVDWMTNVGKMTELTVTHILRTFVYEGRQPFDIGNSELVRYLFSFEQHSMVNGSTFRIYVLHLISVRSHSAYDFTFDKLVAQFRRITLCQIG